jgi:sulfatase maturation enzyme AslB (radical SAM superfamily)
MANQKIFCAVPWHNTHLYWDGTYGACCYESQKPAGQQQNINNTSLVQWYSGDTMQHFRQRILGDDPLPECTGCYYEESHDHQSRRIKENFKVAIFTEQAFAKSFEQSSWNKKFTADTDKLPIDWHIDFGNECNLACKMCWPAASSKIASHFSKWNIPYKKDTNWINDTESWNQLLKNVESVPNLHRIHVMGGEPAINKKFLQFVEWLVEQNLTHLTLSFVTNGTIINQRLIDNLKKFRKVDIEVSVESVEDNNHYIRQGSSTQAVWKNIEYLHTLQNESFSLVLRSVPQLLNVNNYHKYILRAFDLGISVQSIPLSNPSYLAISVLPYNLRQTFRQNYIDVRQKIFNSFDNKFSTLSVGRDTSRLPQQLIRECDTIIEFLDAAEPNNVSELREELIKWLIQWDQEYKLDARSIYPEYLDFLVTNGYKI